MNRKRTIIATVVMVLIILLLIILVIAASTRKPAGEIKTGNPFEISVTKQEDHTVKNDVNEENLPPVSNSNDSASVKKLISGKKEFGWEFLFIGANIDSVETARTMGISEDKAVNYHADKKGTATLYGAVACAVSSLRNKGAVNSEWREEIKRDYEERK